MDNEIKKQRRDEAMTVLSTLLRRLQSIHADILYVALTENGFSDDEACRLAGAILRTAKANGWCVRTDYSLKSKRNHSNLQSVWLSKVFGKQPNGKPVSEQDIKREYSRWSELGYSPPDHLATAWKVAQTFTESAEVSYQQPPQDRHYGATVMR
jgi:hypothetical protein